MRPVSLRRPSTGALSACGTAMCGVSFRWGFWRGGSEGDDLHGMSSMDVIGQ